MIWKYQIYRRFDFPLFKMNLYDLPLITIQRKRHHMRDVILKRLSYSLSNLDAMNHGGQFC
ncbi:hypothetical protein [Guptibacillus hwajinpoensis]